MRYGALIAILLVSCCFAASVNHDIVIADFEGNTYGEGWVTTGTAFGDGPAKGAFDGQRKVSGFEGKGLVNTYLSKDISTGTLTSPEFKIERKYIKFLIGGGKHEGQTCINLIINGKVVSTQTGPDDEQLRWGSWDVSRFAGRGAKIEIVDNATGRWGHINIDSIIQTDKPAWYDMETKITVQKKYLNIPIDNAKPQEPIFVYVGGKIDYYLDVQLADPGKIDFWVYMDISDYKGGEITLKTTRASADDPEALGQLYQSDEPKEAASFYKEKSRPQFHFTSKRGWLNDSNGLVYYKGEYHLFYQHNPYGWSWGNMHWGHAVSKDLVHWQEFDEALRPDLLGTIYSGSAVVDWNNTSGLGSGDQPPVVAIYTAAGNHSPVKTEFTQCIAYSNDMGRTFQKYPGNPALGNIKGSNRDPKVIWHEQTGKWIMALFIDGKDYALFSSPDLKTWQKLSDFEGGYECPDFFPLALDDNKDNVKWIFWAADGSYFVGDFDGTTFTPQADMQKCYDGGTVYAGQTYSDIPSSDGRRIHIPWLRERGKAFVGMPFNQQMGFPVVFTLRTTDQGPMLFAWPVKEIENIYAKTKRFENKTITADANLLAGMDNDMLDIYAEFEIADDNAVFGFDIRGERFVYDVAAKELTVMDKKIALTPVDGKINMRLLVDRTSMEFFAGDGLVYVPYCLPVSDDKTSPRVFSEGGKTHLSVLAVNELKSIWK